MTAPKALWQPDVPYNQLPRLPPTQEVETKTVLRACIPPGRVSPAETVLPA